MKIAAQRVVLDGYRRQHTGPRYVVYAVLCMLLSCSPVDEVPSVCDCGLVGCGDVVLVDSGRIDEWGPAETHASDLVDSSGDLQGPGIDLVPPPLDAHATDDHEGPNDDVVETQDWQDQSAADADLEETLADSFADAIADTSTWSDLEDAEQVPDDAVDVWADNGFEQDLQIVPGKVGDPCTTASDCAGDVCLEGANGGVCSGFCISHTDCKKSGFACLKLEVLGLRCVPFRALVCKPCKADMDCYDPVAKLQHYCITNESGESWCHQNAGYPCGPDYKGTLQVDPQTGQTRSVCMPEPGVVCGCTAYGVKYGGSMSCSVGPTTGACVGERTCTEDGLTECSSPGPNAEVCNGVDDDCDGEIDEGLPDLDGDGVSDCHDPDDDGDGVPDWTDNCPRAWNPGQGDLNNDGIGDACSDIDQDGVTDALDNCPLTPNLTQTDLNGDGLGDACSDLDGDGILDLWDNCPTVHNVHQEDSDGDGVGDACWDSDGDGIPEAIDNCPFVANPSQDDSDGDGDGDACDADDDNDGWPDTVDCAPKDPTIHPDAVDEPDPLGLDTNCDGYDGVVAESLFVAWDTGSDSNPGTPDSPLRTISAALLLAESDSIIGTIFVSDGTYFETLELSTAIALHGGYSASANWSRGAAQTVVVGSAIGGSGALSYSVRCDGVSAPGVTIEAMTLVASPCNEPGCTSVGVRAVQCVLSLDNVTILASDGAEGAPGAQGVAGGIGAAGHDGQQGTKDGGAGGEGGPGGAGTSGNAGGSGGKGGYGDQGALAGSSAQGTSSGGGTSGALGCQQEGGNGAHGADGGNGVQGAGAGLWALTEVPSGSDGAWGEAGQPGIGGGGGGGGGGSSDCKGCGVCDLLLGCVCKADRGGGGGGGASGGLGGGGGQGGMGGGHSLGISSWNSFVTVGSATIMSGWAGNGGHGGIGGQGGVGGAGGDGGSGKDDSGSGGRGGNGGKGGDGGGGGGGAGGASYCIAKDAASVITVQPDMLCFHGKPGYGGKGGSGGIQRTPASAADGLPGKAGVRNW